MDFTERRRQLRKILEQTGPLLVPGCHDALSARQVESAGFPVLYIGSYATSASRLGLADAGVADLTETVEHARSVVNSVGIPVLADAENGFHHAANIWRTIHAFEHAGISGIHIEDHEFGKHTDAAFVLLPKEEMAQKIRAAVDARRDPNFLIIARTDCYWAWQDANEVVKRLNAYLEAGADMVFPSGIPANELAKIRSQIKGKVMITNQAGQSLADEDAAGVNVSLYYGFTLYAAFQGVKDALDQLKKTQQDRSVVNLGTDVQAFEDFMDYTGFVARAKKYGLVK